MIKNIIFDLGHVLLDLDFERAEQQFKILLQDEFDTVYHGLHEEGHFRAYELGQFDEAVFVEKIKAASAQPLDRQAIIEAWNSMLVHIPKARLDMLEQLKQQYNVFLLSNTNATHINWVDQHLQKEYQLDIHYFEHQLFQKAYYSHTLRLRKPEVEIYEFVLKDAGLKGQETLFIDDREDNIEGGKKLGIHGYHHQIKDDIAAVIDCVLEGGSLTKIS